MIFETITPAPPDAILGLTEAFKKDPRPKKVNLGVGVYVDDHGRTPILQCVKQAEKILLDTQNTKSYLPISGDPEYAQGVQDLVFGAEVSRGQAERFRTAHTPGGTGGLRIGAEFLKKFSAASKVWLSAPTWPNHKGVFSAAGFSLADYPYYDAATYGVDFAGMKACLSKIPAGDIVLLHVCCHNPTGADLTPDQWREVAAIAQRQKWLPFLDFAYQGFGDGLVEDRSALQPLLETGLDMLIASSFSKNFGLYQERVGALTLVAPKAQAADAAFSHVKSTIRVVYSNPSAHGGAVVTAILKDELLRRLWEDELHGMRNRIAGVRAKLVEELRVRGVQRDFSFISRQKGMFSFSGLSDAQVQHLRDHYGIYMVGGGRMNVAGLTSANIAYVCDSLAEMMRSEN